MGFWMGLDNFYMYGGGGVEIIPSNSGDQSTCLHYVFDDINWGQKIKSVSHGSIALTARYGFIILPHLQKNATVLPL